MTPQIKPEILSKERMLAKYQESNIEANLHSFKKIEREYRNFRRRSEIYIDRQTRRKKLVRWFLENENGVEEMCVTYLVWNDKIYQAERD